jgi:hypothetical protein
VYIVNAIFPSPVTRHDFFPIFEYSANLNSFIMDNDQEKKLELSNEGVYHLNSTWKWTLFMAIVGFVMVAFIFILAIAIGPIVRAFGGGDSLPYFSSMAIGVMYFFIGVVALVPVIFLYLFSIKAKKAIQLKNTYFMDQAFKNLKYHYIVTSVLTIIGLGIYFLVGLAAGLTALFQ